MVVEGRENIEVLGQYGKGSSLRFIHTLAQSHKTGLTFTSVLFIWFCSSRPASVCITSVPRMDRAPSSGWTGFRAVSLMPDAHGQHKQKEGGSTRAVR